MDVVVWAINALGPSGSGDVLRHEVVQLAVCNLQQHGHLVVVDPEGDGDQVIGAAIVSEPDRHCMKRRQLPDSEGSVHSGNGKEAPRAGHQ
jgi:hypothetical protein